MICTPASTKHTTRVHLWWTCDATAVVHQTVRQGRISLTKFPLAEVSGAVFEGGEAGGQNVHHIVQAVSGKAG